MKNLKNTKAFTAASFSVGIINFLAAAFAVSRLPEKVPVHFDINGVCNGFGSRWGLLLVAAVPMILSFIFLLAARLIKTQQPKLITFTGFIVSLFFSVEFWFIYMLSASGIQLGDKIEKQPAISSLPLLFSALFIILGNFTPIMSPNKAVGLRIKWTLENPQCWKATHRFMGKLMVATGLITALISVIVYVFMPANMVLELVIIFIMIVVNCVIPSIYAYKHKDDKLLAE